MRLLFGFQARVSRRTYLVAGVVLMGIKYASDALVVLAVTGQFFSPLGYINPVLSLRSKAIGGGPDGPAPQWLLVLLTVWALPYLWVGVSMTMRRAHDAGKSPWLGLLFFVPGLNYLTLLVLALLPSKDGPAWPAMRAPVVVDARLKSALLGVAAGLGIAGSMAGLSIYVLGSYGAALFMGTPFAMGAAASYLHNRGHARTMSESIVVALLSVGMAGACFFLFALEGIFCLAMAAPIGAAIAMLGAVVGRAMALSPGAVERSAAAALFALPLLCGAEAAFVPPLSREVQTVVEVDAPPAVVWQRVVAFGELPPPPEWFFQAGIAYPIHARIEGTGVGAVRYCEFSTGPFVEPITTWDEPRRLAFDVRSQPAPMTEWSPWAVVDAPHLDGFIQSQRGEFRLVPTDGGTRTRLEGSTWYTLHMAPGLYWRVFAEALLHGIHTRVLDHVKHLAEADVAASR